MAALQQPAASSPPAPTSQETGISYAQAAKKSRGARKPPGHPGNQRACPKHHHGQELADMRLLLRAREKHEGDPSPAPVLAPTLGRRTLSHSPRLEPEKTPDLGPGAGLSRGRAPQRRELPEAETPMGDPKLPRATEVDPTQAESITRSSEDKIRKRQDRLEAQVEEDIKTLRKEMEEGKNTRKNEMEGMLNQVTNALQQISSTVQQIQQQLTALQMRVENA
ncbi:hypothetical protein HPB50_023952 [Hyalomma asiaticum]|uniref:Uncharacterized protein n=1 Tax=Hyalomma asiaticum TaxID=266040 RepID=A0ACB7S319_HYAAI|nr:hypothetical protein HPB50_023952 [Hyalomma asiaticum]